MFVNRKEELEFLERKYQEPGSQLLTLYGRRRVGKTELVLKFTERKPNVYFLAIRASEKENLELFFKALAEHFGQEVLTLEKTWENAFRFLSKSNERLVLVFDEFPYLIEANPAIPSIFQRGWDLYLSKTNLVLVLVGSSIGMMENEVLSHRSPLYGRRTGQWKLAPLSFKHLKDFFPSYSAEDRVRVYATLGGVPAYLVKFDPREDFWENVRKKLLTKGEFLYGEVEFLLKEELREPKIYASILRGIAAGASTLGELMNLTGIERYKLSAYLQTLVELDLVRREVPITENELKSKKGRYFISDNFFAFWFRYVVPNLSRLEKGESAPVLDEIRKDFDSYLGKVFEDLAIEFLREQGYPRVGRWWHGEDEIDAVAMGEETVFCEVKWSDLDRAQCMRIIQELKRKSTKVKVRRVGEKFGIIGRRVQEKDALRKEGYLVWDLEDLSC
jgi:AAA+ ATPase superfamily predicted ATPase